MFSLYWGKSVIVRLVSTYSSCSTSAFWASWVGDMLSLYHHISSAWNWVIACEAHEKDNPLSVVALHWHSMSSDIPDIPHSVPLPIVLHVVSLSPSYLIVTYKNLHQDIKGFVDPDIEWAQLWICIETVIYPPTMLPLCDSASHSLPQKPIAQRRPLPSWWGFHWMCYILASYPPPVRLYWDRKYCTVTLTLV